MNVIMPSCLMDIHGYFGLLEAVPLLVLFVSSKDWEIRSSGISVNIH
jgi:hypothetical protein